MRLQPDAFGSLGGGLQHAVDEMDIDDQDIDQLISGDHNEEDGDGLTSKERELK